MCHGQFHFHMSHAQHEELESYNQFILTLPLNILMALPRKVFAVIGITFLVTAYRAQASRVCFNFSNKFFNVM